MVTFAKGEIVEAFYAEDKLWWDAKVVSMKNKTVKVRYLACGTLEKADIKNIRKKGFDDESQPLTEFTSEGIKDVDERVMLGINSALSSLGLSAKKINTCTMIPEHYVVRLMLSVASASKASKVETESWTKLHKKFGLDGSWLYKTLTLKGAKYRIVGLNLLPNGQLRTKGIVIDRLSDDTRHKCTVKDVVLKLGTAEQKKKFATKDIKINF